MADTDAARRRLALAQAALLTALTAGGPVPEGFDRARLRVQREALAAKRAGVLARVAPELRALLGDGFRPAALEYAARHPMTGGYRQDALSFAAFLLDRGRLPDRAARRRVAAWLRARGARRPGLLPGRLRTPRSPWGPRAPRFPLTNRKAG